MEFVEVRSRRSPPKPRRLYRVALVLFDYIERTEKILDTYETWAVSEKQAINNINYRAGRAQSISEIQFEYYRVLKDDEQP